MKSRPFEILEHTADIGLRIRGKSLEELFLNAAAGLFFLIAGEDRPASAGKAPETKMKFSEEKTEQLFLKWLRELLFYFSAKRYILDSIRFEELNEKSLRASAGGWIFDPARDEQHYEVKAVTYHQFKFEKKKDGSFEAEMILDI